MVQEPVARANLPRGREQLAVRLGELAERARALLTDDTTLGSVAAFQAAFRYPRETYDLPGVIQGGDQHYRLKVAGLRIVEQAGRAGIVREGSRQAIELPMALKPLMAWVLARPGFSRRELADAFPDRDAAAIEQFLAEVVRMGIIAAAT